MKKLISLIMTGLLTMVTFAGCGAEENPSSSEVATSSETVTTSAVSSEPATTTSKDTSTSSKKESSSSKKKKPSSSREETSSEEEIQLSAKEKIYYGMDPEIYSLSLKNKGNSARIANLMKKAQKGGNYKIAVLGGSISQGAGASNSFSNYGSLVYDWWCYNFPDANFEFINAGIGSTNPEMACYRMGEDLLKFNPDFVVVDFTVNTYLDYDLKNTYSTILYKILSQKNSPAVMSIDFTSCDRDKHDLAMIYEKTKSVPNSSIDAAVKAYDVPAMSYHTYVWEKIKKNKLSWRDIGFDYIHPNDNGHMIAANIITCYLEKVMDNLSKESTKITAPKAPEVDDYLNLGYVINTAKNAKTTGNFTARPNSSSASRGWDYTKNNTFVASSLYLPVPANMSIKVFMSFTGSEKTGFISVTDSKGNAKTISSDSANTPTLVDIGAMEGSITLKPSADCSSFVIYGIGIEK